MKTQIRTRTRRLMLGAALAFAWASEAGAALLTCGAGEVCFELNYYLTGNTAALFNPAYSYGTLKISDLADTGTTGKVHIDIDLVNNFSNGDVASLKVQKLWLNLVDSPGNDADWSVANANPSFSSVAVGSSSSPPGYNFAFDFELPDTGNIGFEPISFDLLWSALPSDDSLIPADFLEATNNLIYAAVHVGSCGPNDNYICQGGTGNSITVGAGEPGGGPPTGVPEPGTLALIAFGMLTFAWVFRRKRVIA